MSKVHDLPEMFVLVKEIASEIRTTGDENAATELLDALTISTVPGEIIGATGSVVTQLQSRSWSRSVENKMATVAKFILNAYPR